MFDSLRWFSVLDIFQNCHIIYASHFFILWNFSFSIFVALPQISLHTQQSLTSKNQGICVSRCHLNPTTRISQLWSMLRFGIPCLKLPAPSKTQIQRTFPRAQKRLYELIKWKKFIKKTRGKNIKSSSYKEIAETTLAPDKYLYGLSRWRSPHSQSKKWMSLPHICYMFLMRSKWTKSILQSLFISVCPGCYLGLCFSLTWKLLTCKIITIWRHIANYFTIFRTINSLEPYQKEPNGRKIFSFFFFFVFTSNLLWGIKNRLPFFNLCFFYI